MNDRKGDPFTHIKVTDLVSQPYKKLKNSITVDKILYEDDQKEK